jgi:hypothetical protein
MRLYFVEFLDHEYEIKPFGIPKASGFLENPLGIERVKHGNFSIVFQKLTSNYGPKDYLFIV